MSLTIKRGKSLDPLNKVDRVVDMVDLDNADIKDNSDILNPQLIVSVPTGTKAAYFTGTNMVFIKAFERWYNVDSVEFTNANRALLKCSVDVLKTYAADIKAANLFVARNEQSYDPTIPDALLPKEAYQERTLSVGQNAIADPTSPTVVVITSSMIGFTAYMMNTTNYNSLMDRLWSINFDSLFQKNPIENFVRVFALPWSLSYLAQFFAPGTAATNKIFAGEKEIEPENFSAYAHYCGAGYNAQTIINTGIMFPITNDEWRRKDTRYRLILPYAGELNIPSGDVYPFITSAERVIPITYILDITSGDLLVSVATFHTTNGDLRNYTIRGNAAVDLPMSAGNATQRVASSIGGGVASAVGLAAALSAPEISGAALAGIGLGAVTQQMGAQMQSSSVTGTLGGSLSWAEPQKIYLFTYEDKYAPSAGFNHAHGRPLYQTKTGSSLSGFTVCENVQISYSGTPVPTDAEKQQIKSLLETGVIF